MYKISKKHWISTYCLFMALLTERIKARWWGCSDKVEPQHLGLLLLAGCSICHTFLLLQSDGTRIEAHVKCFCLYGSYEANSYLGKLNSEYLSGINGRGCDVVVDICVEQWGPSFSFAQLKEMQTCARPVVSETKATIFCLLPVIQRYSISTENTLTKGSYRESFQHFSVWKCKCV